MGKPTFSVIIPTLNEELFLPKLLRSLVHQTDQDFEVIVSDGNSQDKTAQVVKRFGVSFKKRIHFVQNETPGLPKQRNAGAKIAVGKYFLFIDADGMLFPYAIERMKEYVSGEQIHHFSSWFAPDRQTVSDALLVLLMNAFMEGGIMVKRPFAHGQSAVISREMFERVGGYDERIAWGEDNDISRRIYEAGVMLQVLRETLVIYSLRRFRKQGNIRMLQVYARAVFEVLLKKKSTDNIPRYIMGGHLYKDGETTKTKSILKEFRDRLEKITKDFFE